jgi:nitrate/TMAO reductase-like tetraheme cytochrome c subunit
MKNIKLSLSLLLLLSVCNVFALDGKHDFSAETWSEGRSCLICHSLANDVPKVSPPGSRVINIEKLEGEEKSAYEANSSNVMCLVCHQAQHSTVAPKNNSGTTGTLPAPQNPGTVTGPSGASTNIRVINRGANSLECLKCHDLHNKDSEKMLKVDYYQN